MAEKKLYDWNWVDEQINKIGDLILFFLIDLKKISKNILLGCPGIIMIGLRCTDLQVIFNFIIKLINFTKLSFIK